MVWWVVQATFAGSALFVKNSPPAGSTAELYVYTSEPGDVLFFPESWGHAVYTYEGPSVMVNYRKMVVGNFLRQPVTWLEALIGNVFFKKLTNQGKAAATIKVNRITLNYLTLFVIVYSGLFLILVYITHSLLSVLATEPEDYCSPQQQAEHVCAGYVR